MSVQHQDFDVAAEYAQLRQGNNADGALVFFVGTVRDRNLGDGVCGLRLEHYPGMSERILTELVEQAFERWPVSRVRLLHRVGDLELSDQIVLVAASSPHREAAFAACEFLMDFLKSRAPFWKQEAYLDADGTRCLRWIEGREKDRQALQRWDNIGADSLSGSS